MSSYFTNRFTAVRPIRRVNVDLTEGMLRALDERAARLNISRQAVIKTLSSRLWFRARPENGRAGNYHAEVGRTVNQVVLYYLMALAANEQASASARAVASDRLNGLRLFLQGLQSAEAFYAAQQIERFQRDPKVVPMPRPAEPPPGQPIGME